MQAFEQVEMKFNTTTIPASLLRLRNHKEEKKMELISLVFNEWKNLCAKEADLNREDRRVISSVVSF